MRFFLGTHRPYWLWKAEGMPLFVSHRQLAQVANLWPAVTDWALDSGGFSELAAYGGWRTTPGAYVEAARRYMDEIGRMQWAAPQDWMCEPGMLGKTGLTVGWHQRFTVQNFCLLRQMAPDVNFIPVLQGWRLDDYLRCIDLYREAGVDLASFRTIGLGSVCRRQHTEEIAEIVGELSSLGLRLHGFGVKIQGLASYRSMLTSSDSMSWSLSARKNPPLPGCSHANCANCMLYARAWYERVK